MKLANFVEGTGARDPFDFFLVSLSLTPFLAMLYYGPKKESKNLEESSGLLL